MKPPWSKQTCSLSPTYLSKMNDWTTVTQRENPASSHQHLYISLHLVTYPLPSLLFLVSMDTQHSLLSKVSLSTWALDPIPLSYSGLPCGLHPLSYIVHIFPRLLHPHVHALGISLNSLIFLHVSLTHFSTFFQLQSCCLHSPTPTSHSNWAPILTSPQRLLLSRSPMSSMSLNPGATSLFLSSLTSKVKSWWCPLSWNIFFLWLCDSSLSSFSSVSFIGSFSSTQSLEVRGYPGSVLSIVPAFFW